jgi:hypothetical protein
LRAEEYRVYNTKRKYVSDSVHLINMIIELSSTMK